MKIFYYIVYCYFSFFFVNAQINVPQNGKLIEKYNVLVEQEKFFQSDTTSLKAFIAPLSKHKSFLPIYYAFLANSRTSFLDEMDSKSKSLYKKSIAFATELNDNSLIVWSKYNYISYLYKYRKYQTMQPILLDLIENLKKMEATEIIQPEDTFRTIGWIMQTFSDYNESDYYLNLALKYCAPNSSSQASLLDNLGLNFYKRGNFPKAIHYFDRAEKLAFKINDSLRLAKTFGNKALVLESQKKYTEALELLNEDVRISKKLKEDKNTMFALTALGRIYLKMNKFDIAAIVLDQALEIAILKPYFKRSELDIVLLKLELIKFIPNETKELDLRRRLAVLGDSLKSTDGEEQIQLLKWQIQKTKYHQKLREAEIQYKKLKTRKRVFGIIIVFSVLMLLYIYYLQRKKHHDLKEAYERRVLDLEEQKINIEDKLKTSNDSFKHQVEYLKDKNIQINKLKREIEKIKYSSSFYLEAKTGKLNALLESHLMTEENWMSFKRQFEKEYPEFSNYLKTNFPKLTNSNLRIIYLQKLGFSNLEISEILGITLDAVKKAKQRLKKKLGENQDLLFSFNKN